MKLFFSLCSALVLISCSGASKKEAIEAPLPKAQVIDGRTLNLIGSGFRVASRMGFTAKVYKAGFYAEKNRPSPTELLDSSDIKKLYMRFTYTVNKAPLVEGWEKAYKHSCVKNCLKDMDNFKKFIEFSTAMRVGDLMELIFKPDGVGVKITKDEVFETFIASSEFSYNLLSIFIGEKVLDSEFKKSLLKKL